MNKLTDMMQTFVKVMSTLDQHSFGPHGGGWVRKAEMMDAYPKSKPVAYTHLATCSKYFQHHKEAAIYVRINPDMDWAADLDMMRGPIPEWNMVSMSMKSILSMNEMLDGIEHALRRQPYVFSSYSGVCRDMKKCARINANQLKRIHDLLGKMEVDA